MAVAEWYKREEAIMLRSGRFAVSWELLTLPRIKREVLGCPSYFGPCPGATPMGRRYLTASACTLL